MRTISEKSSKSLRWPRHERRRGGRKVRPEGIEPSACGLKDRCSLAPRREPLTTELRARAMDVCATYRYCEHHILSAPAPLAQRPCSHVSVLSAQRQGVSTILSASRRSYTA